MSAKRRFPWYDASWRNSYILARDFIQEHYPTRLPEFVDTFKVLRTNPRFKVKTLPQLFTPATHEEILRVVREMTSAEVEKHEITGFGRTTVHDHEFFTNLQNTITQLVSEVVGEPVEPSYNFLSLYNNLGVLKMHLDAPSCKWTVDYCIEQSSMWPINISQVRPWPEEWPHEQDNWEDAVLDDPDNQFASYELHPGQSLVFAGSSQWHYRDRIQQKAKCNFCHLLFFHFIPQGTRELNYPKMWAKLFGIPELSTIILHVPRPDTSTIA